MKIKLTPRGRNVIFTLMALILLSIFMMSMWGVITLASISGSLNDPIQPAPDKCVSDTVLQYDGTCREQEQ